MIRRLRIKLVAAAMLSLLLVLALVIGFAGILNYRNICNEAESKLQLISENDGNLPEDAGKHIRGASPELSFELRYFSVELDENNAVKDVNIGKIAAVDTVHAASYAQEIASSGKTEGFVESYRYLVTSDDEGNTQIYFVDCYRELQAIRNFLINSVIISLIGSVAVLILLVISSERIVKPVSDSYEKQKRFITDAGHELKTPLTIISADAEVLEMDYGESEWLDDIKSQTVRLADLTNNLVFLARMEEQPQMDRLDFSLSDIAQEAVDDFQAMGRLKEKTLTGSIEPGLTMNGDEKMIRRLMTIFLDNAMKYTNDHGTIRLSLDKWHGQKRLQVYNTTDHIEKEALEHLFDRFYRTDKSRNSKTGGYGLGLSIASAIVATHNGKISASTSDEKSLLITVLLP